MEMPCRSAVYLSFLFLKAPPDRFYSLPLLPQGPDRPIPGTLQGTYRQVVLFKTSLDDPVIGFGRQRRVAAPSAMTYAMTEASLPSAPRTVASSLV